MLLTQASAPVKYLTKHTGHPALSSSAPQLRAQPPRSPSPRQNLSQKTQPRPLQQKTNMAPPGASRCATGSTSRAWFLARCSSDGGSAAGCRLT